MGELYRALSRQIQQGRVRLHMPGHKGALPEPLREAALWDFTEIPGTDSLYEADGCLQSLEERFSRLYQTKRTVLSAGGSTLCIQAMLALTGFGGKILCGRNLHVSALNAMGLLGIDPEFLPCRGGAAFYPPPAPEDLRDAFAAHPDAKAVYVTSPDYYGQIADIAGLSELCRKKGVPLLVDNAHGAHLKFLEQDRHPIAQGASCCCDSLHKMLPALTGAALLHFGSGPEIDSRRAKACMSLFGSTSPSYLIMLSCDLLADRLEADLPDQLKAVAKRVEALADFAEINRIRARTDDPLRLCVPSENGPALREALARQGIEPELCDNMAAVLLFGAGTPETADKQVRAFLAERPSGSARKLPEPPVLVRTLSVREAMAAPSEWVPLEQAAGRTAAAYVSCCPPGIPLAVYGGRIGEDTIFLLKSYGINGLDVVK